MPNKWTFTIKHKRGIKKQTPPLCIAEYEMALDSWQESTSHQDINTDVSSWQETLLMRPVLGKELASEEFWRPEEQRHRQARLFIGLENQWAVVLLAQPRRSAIVKIKTIIPYTEDEPQQVKMLTVPNWPRDEQKLIKAYIKSQKSNRYYLSKADTQKATEVRQKQIEQPPQPVLKFKRGGPGKNKRS